MAQTDTPWFIGMEGVLHSAEVARTLAYAACGGNGGVVSVQDLKITPLSTPGAGVRYGTGAAMLINGYPGGQLQAYTGRKDSSGILTIANATSAKRSDMVIARIYDPQYGSYSGWNPSSPNDFQFFRIEVVQGVPENAVDLPGATYPYVPLARIDLPSGSTAVTQAMIVDLRRKINPLRKEIIRVMAPDRDWNMSKTGYVYWPLYSGSNVYIDVPKWATKMIVEVNFSGIEISTAGNAAGITGKLNNTVADMHHTTIHTNVAGRVSHVHVSQFDIPASYRGTNCVFGTMGYQTLGTGDIQADYQTSVVLKFTFLEEPE